MRYVTRSPIRPGTLRKATPGRILTALCFTAVLAALAGCSDPAGPDPIEAGVWSVSIDSGLTGSFTLAGDPLKLTEVHFVFNEWNCGPITYNGQVTIGTSLEILDRDINATVQWGTDNDQIRFLGAFADSGDHASGTWNGTIYWGVTPHTCSGSWTAQH